MSPTLEPSLQIIGSAGAPITMNQSVARRAYEFVSTPRVVMDITPGIREVARVRIFKGPLASYRFLQRAMSSSFVVVGFPTTVQRYACLVVTFGRPKAVVGKSILLFLSSVCFGSSCMLCFLLLSLLCVRKLCRPFSFFPPLCHVQHCLICFV